MIFEAWLVHNAGAISCCKRLLTGLLYESTAVRLLRRHYAGPEPSLKILEVYIWRLTI
jgi:hypothetical protein